MNDVRKLYVDLLKGVALGAVAGAHLLARRGE